MAEAEEARTALRTAYEEGDEVGAHDPRSAPPVTDILADGIPARAVAMADPVFEVRAETAHPMAEIQQGNEEPGDRYEPTAQVE